MTGKAGNVTVAAEGAGQDSGMNWFWGREIYWAFPFLQVRQIAGKMQRIRDGLVKIYVREGTDCYNFGLLGCLLSQKGGERNELWARRPRIFTSKQGVPAGFGPKESSKRNIFTRCRPMRSWVTRKTDDHAPYSWKKCLGNAVRVH